MSSFTTAAHSNGDSCGLPCSDVIAAGDILDSRLPGVDTAQADDRRCVNGLNRILDLSVAEFRTEGGTLVVPGHGRISDAADVAYYRDMVVMIRDRSSRDRSGDDADEVRPPSRPPTGSRVRIASGPWTTEASSTRPTIAGGGRRRPPRDAAARARHPALRVDSAPHVNIMRTLLRDAAAAAVVCGWSRSPCTERPRRPRPTPRDAAPVDFTGTWDASHHRTGAADARAAKGDYARSLESAGGRSRGLDPARDAAAGEQCRGYGAPAVMRLPGRVRISWESDTVMKLETEAGSQTRLFTFGAQPPQQAPGWQGTSAAFWQPAGGGGGRRGGGAASRGGSLRVVTTGLRPGYLRRNGVPYSANARLTEYYNRANEARRRFLVVTTLVEDPTIERAVVTSTPFKKVAPLRRGKPGPCE